MTQPSKEPRCERRPIPGPRGAALWKFLFEFPRAPHERLLQLVAEYGDIVSWISSWNGSWSSPAPSTSSMCSIIAIRTTTSRRRAGRPSGRCGAPGCSSPTAISGAVSGSGCSRRFTRRRSSASRRSWSRRRSRSAPIWTADRERGEPGRLPGHARLRGASDYARHVRLRRRGHVPRSITVALGDVHDYINPMSVLNVWRVPPRVQRFINPEYPRFRRAYREINGDLRRDRDAAAGRAGRIAPICSA